MIKLKIMHWHDAQKYIMQELENNTEAVCNITHFLIDFPSDIKEMCKILELSEKDETTVNDIPTLPNYMISHIKFLILIIPGLSLLYPSINWENLINSILSILDYYSGVYQTIATENNDTELATEIYEIKNQLIRCGKNIELGATVENLLPILAIVMERIEYMQSTDSYSLELSKEYLHALNMPINENICT